MSDVMKPVVALAMLAALHACRQSEKNRLRDAQQRVAIDGSVAQSEIVRELRSPTDAGRLIYEKQPDLSYETMLRTRPDLAHPDISSNTGPPPPTAALPRTRSPSTLTRSRLTC